MSQTLQAAWHEATAKLSPLFPQTARRDAELLLLHCIGRDRTFLLTHPHTLLTAGQQAAFDAAIARRCTQEPVQYITGVQEFYGLALDVTPAVLIPRPETEHLVEAALERLPADRPARVVDVGTGSGAIAIALAVSRPLLQITALDISDEALAVAQGNARRHGVDSRIRFLRSDLLTSVPDDPPVELIASNPPYVPEDDRTSLAAEVRDFEPAPALFAGDDGLAVYRRLIPAAYESLLPGGWLLLEIGFSQQASVAALLHAWEETAFVPDLQGIARVAAARKPGSRQSSGQGVLRS